MRIVSLLPSATEIVCTLGLAENLVGISHDCDYPAEIQDRPRLTRSRLPRDLPSEAIHQKIHDGAAQGESLYEIDTERLAALAPELVVTQRQCSVCAVGEADAVRALAQANSHARLLTLSASRFAEMPEDIRRLGRATDREPQAEELIGQLEARLENVRRATRGLDQPRVFCLSWFNPLMAAGHWVTEMVELAGGEDRLGARGATSSRLEPSALEAYAPEVILLIPCGFTQERTRSEWEVVRAQPPWKNLPAVQAGKVFVVDGSLFHRPGPRLIEGVESLAGLLHPKRQRVLSDLGLVQRVS
jgi:iron complex transport system substrate-binding protein